MIASEGDRMEQPIQLQGLNHTTRKRESVKHVVRAKNYKLIELNLTRKSAILAFCMECLGWEGHPSECTVKLCPLYPYRGYTGKTLNGTIPDSYHPSESEVK